MLKKHLDQATLMLNPKDGEPLLLYLAVTTEVVSSVLLREDEGR